MAHGYRSIELETVWLIVTRSVPALRDRLVALLAELG